jgi:acyl-CoA reductase-like NAD-dependent aldehyde dehydrogenase
MFWKNIGYDEFKDLLVEMVLEKYKPGDPMLDNTNLGPLAEPD